MNDFGPKRPMPESVETAPTDIAKAKRGRPKKKPDYDREKEIDAFQAKAVELFGERRPNRTIWGCSEHPGCGERHEYDAAEGAEDAGHCRGLQHEAQP